jgi:hypothetical protein
MQSYFSLLFILKYVCEKVTQLGRRKISLNIIKKTREEEEKIIKINTKQNKSVQLKCLVLPTQTKIILTIFNQMYYTKSINTIFFCYW